MRELLEGCDIVSVHVPATAETNGLIGSEELRLMRPGSVLVNTARASVVREADLDRALRDPGSGPWHAAVDVFEVEGSGFASPLGDNPHCTLSPHAAGMTRAAMEEASRRIVAAFARYVEENGLESGGPGRCRPPLAPCRGESPPHREHCAPQRRLTSGRETA
ncbi:NAD(P)-dependent oxidoreductase [Streptomyces sp. NPDC057686]|uniref:NAD(P)-dependent oxidoreductase n=1 Tax=Streptomyces sp. NPDC057686 TaxID=3346212 RepID=UPI003683C2DD